MSGSYGLSLTTICVYKAWMIRYSFQAGLRIMLYHWIQLDLIMYAFTSVHLIYRTQRTDIEPHKRNAYQIY